MRTDILMWIGGGILIGFVLAKVIGRRDDTRIVWTEPIDPDEADAEVKALVRDGRIIEAIKRHREITGVGLKEAKDFVDALKVNLPRDPG